MGVAEGSRGAPERARRATGGYTCKDGRMYCTKEGCIAQATEITTYSTFIAELKAERAPEGRWSRLRRPLPGSAGKVPGLVNAGFFFFLAVGSVTPTVPRPRT